MNRGIRLEPLTAEAFAPFGDVLEASGEPDLIINQGFCGRYHDRAKMDFGEDGRPGLSLFLAKLRTLPLMLDMVERHPSGSQAYIPMSLDPFLVIVAPDAGGVPGLPRVFLTTPGQGVNYHRGVWHGVLTPLQAPGLFAVIDRIGSTSNLEEYRFADPFLVEP
jgi:ureidoglycolate lyase